MEKRVFGNRYQVTERVGMGGMAEVFKATDSTLGRTVAVKVMLPQYAADKTFAARFQQEAKAAANLTSPYIVNIYDWGRDEDSYYIIMEYVRGTDLKTAVQERGSIHPRKVAEIGSQVCSALSVAHSYGIIHRDIKSANIMVQTDGNVKVMDFGIAQAGNSDMTQDSSVLGTAHYVSPEQAQGKSLTGASDLYSLGVVMYEAATGQLPFDGSDAVSVAMKQVSEEPIPPRQINPDIDPALEAIILRAMSKSTAERYATANEMKQALDDFLAGRGVATVGATQVIGAGGAPGVAETTVISPTKGVEGAKKGGATQQKPQDDTRKKRVIAAVVAVVILAAIALGVAFGTGVLGGTGNVETSIVPDVTNATLEDATATLKEYGFEVGEVTYKTSETVEQGLVISQDPRGNDAAEKGAKVNLVISEGSTSSKTVAVPNLLGLSPEAAEQQLSNAGLIGVASQEYSDDYPANQVCAQNPSALSEVPTGSTVTYTVSLGASVKNVSVVSVIGQSEDAARAALEGQGLKVTVKTGYSDNVGTGEVMDQSIPSGTSVEEGTSITITVSKGKQTMSVPNVVGYSESKARSTLKNAGFTAEVEYVDNAEEKVVDQSPTGGDAATNGSAVTIWVGTGVIDTGTEGGGGRGTDYAE